MLSLTKQWCSHMAKYRSRTLRVSTDRLSNVNGSDETCLATVRETTFRQVRQMCPLTKKLVARVVRAARRDESSRVVPVQLSGRQRPRCACLHKGVGQRASVTSAYTL